MILQMAMFDCVKVLVRDHENASYISCSYPNEIWCGHSLFRVGQMTRELCKSHKDSQSVWSREIVTAHNLS
jgi:hypothetical protein